MRRLTTSSVIVISLGRLISLIRVGEKLFDDITCSYKRHIILREN